MPHLRDTDAELSRQEERYMFEGGVAAQVCVEQGPLTPLPKTPLILAADADSASDTDITVLYVQARRSCCSR